MDQPATARLHQRIYEIFSSQNNPPELYTAYDHSIYAQSSFAIEVGDFYPTNSLTLSSTKESLTKYVQFAPIGTPNFRARSSTSNSIPCDLTFSCHLASPNATRRGNNSFDNTQKLSQLHIGDPNDYKKGNQSPIGILQKSSKACAAQNCNNPRGIYMGAVQPFCSPKCAENYHRSLQQVSNNGTLSQQQFSNQGMNSGYNSTADFAYNSNENSSTRLSKSLMFCLK